MWGAPAEILNNIVYKIYIFYSQSGVLPKVGCTIGVFSKLQLNEPPKVGFLSEVGCGVRLLKF